MSTSNDWKLFNINDGVSECRIDGLKFASKYMNPYWIASEMEAFKVENRIRSGHTNGIINRMEVDDYHRRVRPVVYKLLVKAVRIANREGASVKILDLA
jgi:hypothetical protein